MASKLEKHTELIARRLGEGASKAAIAAELSAAGTETTPQNIGQWLQSRQARIRSRKKVIGRLIAGKKTNPN